MKTRHGLCGSRFYRIWTNMISRCKYHTNSDWGRYGGRGIKVCSRWKVFFCFMKDMYKSYLKHCRKFGEKDTTIDRINSFKNYTRRNCRWATVEEQSNNRRSNHLIIFNNKVKTIQQWSKQFNIRKDTLWSRIVRYNWPIDIALNTPIGVHRFNYNSYAKKK